MDKKSLILQIKKFIKIFVSYRLENEFRVYSLRGTPFRIRTSLRREFEEKWADIPVQRNKIVFDNYMGKGYGCNGRYVTEELLKTPGKYRIVWVVKDAEKHRKDFPKEVELVEYLSPEAFRAYASAGFWVCNYHLIAYLNRGLQKKDGQTYIQLWHGSFGIKKIEGDCSLLTKEQPWLYLARKSSALTDYWISNSSFETQVYRHAFWDVSTVLEYGHPRNDLFFRPTEDISRRVREFFRLSSDKKLVLYVPTFRDTTDAFPEELDAALLLESLTERFGGTWVFLLRLHPRMLDNFQASLPENAVDASVYPDIQELLAAADTVITDYSSCVFDFMLTGKPGFLFAPDSDDYEKMRGLYYPLSDTPFPLAHSNEELSLCIRGFEKDAYRNRIRSFLQEKGSVEDGAASVRVKNLIDTLIEKEWKNE